MRAFFESAFDVVYLVLVVTLGIRMLRKAEGRRQFQLFGAMAVVLGAGDAFHLVPRMIALWTDGFEAHAAALGIGKLITSVTMTVFYVLLYYVWRERYGIRDRKSLSAAVWLLAVVRVVLCFMKQNEWTSVNPPLSWGIYRNIPFALLGLLVIVLFYVRSHVDASFRWLWLTIVLSFAFYIPVVLFSHQYPAVGMLMIPKTCAYVWTVWIGYQAMKGERK
ncbi:MAG: hypothetical protein MR707_00360 [Galactobacillus timonensis]|uniref:hypothetical protein n=1 Tax=Galactobacillus timonensis TaxID=2041840 RepID=UPI0023F2CB47|nr:hypothetical protein [Galactobacillus timonensis]MDY5223246.1 hypothetical protein [Lachnospiraceae bacterium]MDY6282319.1 hypothetical protein [Erysipelotrichaceae bacterium]MCI6066670.1 hypothetical protein [Galactobacillus timonensis]MCI6753995.1 hypothetical protein [Galactobacillus timonensis]MDD7086506.1 hypothetical protein [Galactobacillus timonensis]